MLDHLGVMVRSSDESKRFYTAALAPLGYALVEKDEYGKFRVENKRVL